MAIEYLTENTVNKRSRADFTDDEWHKFMDAMQELIDVEHNIEILKIAIEGLTEETTPNCRANSRRHNEKCRNRGCRKKRKTACQERPDKNLRLQYSIVVQLKSTSGPWCWTGAI